MAQNQKFMVLPHGYVKAMKNGKKVLDECKVDANCYVKKLTSKEGQDRKTDMIGLKSAQEPPRG